MARSVATKGAKAEQGAAKTTGAKATGTKTGTGTKSAKPTSGDAELDRKISERAYRIWEDEGRPDGRAESHWQQAREIVALETAGLPKKSKKAGIDTGTGAGAAGEPNQAIENTGEYPGLRDQGDEGPRAPRRRKAVAG